MIAVYGLYSAGRLVARGDVSTAVDHGLGVLRAEQSLRLDVVRPLNRLFSTEAWLGIAADYVYASLHYVLTPLVLVWLWRRRPSGYRAMRTWLLTSTVLGLAGFTLFPTCPPRLLDPAYGFVDTMARYADYGWWAGEASAPEGLGGLTNQYAAMPSLHVGWSLWCAVVVWRYAGGRRAVRAPVFLYPLAITLVVMGTANHYLLDAVAGVAVMGLGLLLTPAVQRAAGALRDRFAPVRRGARGPVAPAGTTVVRTGGAVHRGSVPQPRRGAPGPGGTPVRTAPGAPAVGAGCQTARRTAPTREAPEATADDDTPRPHGGRQPGPGAAGAADTPAPATR